MSQQNEVSNSPSLATPVTINIITFLRRGKNFEFTTIDNRLKQ